MEDTLFANVYVSKMITKMYVCQDDEGKTGPFLDELRGQFKNEKMAYVEDVKQELENVS